MQNESEAINSAFSIQPFALPTRGIIALDIDGTISTTELGLTAKVHDFLQELTQQGWLIVFITGRTFSYAIKTLQACQFHYLFAVENGATLLAMPNHQIIRKRYLSVQTLHLLEEASAKYGSDLIVCTGVEDEGRCYYRPERFEKGELEYLLDRQQQANETWVALESFEQIPREEFAYAKCFASFDACREIAHHATTHAMVASVVIVDPLRPTHAVLLMTHPTVSKGGTLRECHHMFAKQLPTIAAGDDANDESMIEEADVGIAMANAPEFVRQKAQIIAPPAAEEGIITGLKEAIASLYGLGLVDE
jgi:HAD superfamily hydrolase (TIGR01484 family)